MAEFFKTLLTSEFMPHGHCYFWKPHLIWLHVISDGLIALAYMSIPLSLAYFVSKRRDVPYPWIFYLFVAFIFFCGLTHIFNIWTIWVPVYWFDGWVKLLTGLISVATAILMVPLIPKALGLPSIRVANQELEKLAQELRRSNEELQHFASVASHDLQEPLHSISGHSEILSRRYATVLDDKGHVHLTHILSAVKRMNGLIQDLLKFSRIESQAAPFARVDLNAVVQSALHILAGKIKAGDVTITTDTLPTVTGDSNQLVQVFQNLISNALKYRSDKPLQIHIGSQDSPEGYKLFVRDNGIGIEKVYHQEIFAMFRRLHSPDKYPGSGIGLAVCMKIIQHHNGKIWVESEPGQGATFLILLPKLI